jgi:hypothetical protein
VWLRKTISEHWLSDRYRTAMGGLNLGSVIRS